MDRRPRVVRDWISRHRTALTVGFVVVGVVAVLGLLGAYELARASRDVQTARTLIDEARAGVENGELAMARAKLTDAQLLLTQVNERLYNKAPFDLSSWMPVVSTNLDGLREGVGTALTLVSGGRQLLEITQPLENEQGRLDVPLEAGTLPLDVVREVQIEVTSLASHLPDLGEKPSSRFLLGPVQELADTVYEEASERKAQLINVGRALELLVELAGGNGDRRYLLAVANTAEMRGSGGMILAYGILESNDGTFTLPAFGGIDELALDSVGPVDPAGLQVPDDFLRRWDGLQPTFLWRNANLAPEFDQMAPIMAAMYERGTGQHVDAVIQVDPAGLGAFLVGTGAVDVPDVGLVTADNVVATTLNQTYIDFPDRDTRQEVLTTVAEATFTRLVSGNLDTLRPLGEALFEAAASRHLIFWSEHPTAQARAATFGATGLLPPPDADYAHLTVQNFSKNKLDYYVETSLAIEGSRPIGTPGEMTATISVVNSAPANIPSTYITGPNAAGEEAGLYRATVSLYVPNGAVLEASEGGPAAAEPVLVAELGRSVVTYPIELAPGDASTVTLQLRLPPRPPLPYTFTLVPVPRVLPTTYRVTIRDDTAQETYSYGPAPLGFYTVVGAPSAAG